MQVNAQIGLLELLFDCRYSLKGTQCICWFVVQSATLPPGATASNRATIPWEHESKQGSRFQCLFTPSCQKNNAVAKQRTFWRKKSIFYCWRGNTDVENHERRKKTPTTAEEALKSSPVYTISCSEIHFTSQQSTHLLSWFKKWEIKEACVIYSGDKVVTARLGKPFLEVISFSLFKTGVNSLMRVWLWRKSC